MSLAWKKLTLDLKVKETFFCCSPVFHWILYLDLQLSLLFQDIVLYALYMYSTWNCPTVRKGVSPSCKACQEKRLPTDIIWWMSLLRIAYKCLAVRTLLGDLYFLMGMLFSTIHLERLCLISAMQMKTDIQCSAFYPPEA